MQTLHAPVSLLISLLIISLLGAGLAGCGNDEPTANSADSSASSDTTSDSAASDGGSTTPAITALFKSGRLLGSAEVDCTLDNGDKTTCYQLKFAANPVPYGPFCPATVNDVGGLGVYDGKTNPGFQVMKKSLFEAMEADGYDVIDDKGNIRGQDPGDMSQKPEAGKGYCLTATFDDKLELTFLIPKKPRDLTAVNEIGTVELFGVSLDGVPMNGDPPSVVSGMGPGGAIPALDPCGGHPDPSGYYHWHFVAESMNLVLAAYKITEVTCTNVTQAPSALVGIAKDGYPVYGPHGADGKVPSDLDSCGGHKAVTAAYPGGVYHYHALETEAPNMPGCVKGASVDKAFSYASK